MATILYAVYLNVHINKTTLKIVRLLIQHGRYDILQWKQIFCKVLTVVQLVVSFNSGL